MRTDVECAYVAGFVDGEACIRVQYNRAKGIYMPQVKIAAVKPAVLDKIIAWYGGWKREYQPQSAGNNANLATEWTLQGREHVLALMNDILPYVIVKRPQVELMRAFILEGEKSKPPKPVSPGEIARREEIFNRFKELNKRGRNAA